MPGGPIPAITCERQRRERRSRVTQSMATRREHSGGRAHSCDTSEGSQGLQSRVAARGCSQGLQRGVAAKGCSAQQGFVPGGNIPGGAPGGGPP